MMGTMAEPTPDDAPARGIPADPVARRKWAEEFVEDIVSRPHDDEATWGKRGIEETAWKLKGAPR